MNFRLLSFVLVVIGFQGLLYAQKDERKPIPLNPEVRTGQLANGLTYFILKNQKPENRAELRLVVNAGSLQENDDQQGLAHFTEHMMFNGTEHFKKNELIDFFELNGMQFGAHVNAYTSFDETVYMLKARTDDANIFEQSFQVLEDWAHLATFDDEEIDKERGVVIEEWRLRLGASNRMMTEYYPVQYYNSRYADRLPIGQKAVLDTFHYPTIKQFYADWYRPDLMAIVAVGDFDVNAVEQKIKAHFSGLKNPVSERPRVEYDVPDHKDMKVKVVTDKEATYSIVNILYKHPHREIETTANYRYTVMSQLFRTMMGYRYEELKQQAQPPFMFAGSGYGSMSRTKDQFSTFAYAGEVDMARTLQVLLEENERVRQYGFTAGELDLAKKDLLRAYKSAFEEKDKQESRNLVNEFVYYFLDGEPAPGIDWEYKTNQQLLPAISVKEINDLAKEWITEENVVVIVTAPEVAGNKVPTEDEVRNIYEEVQDADIEPYTDRGAVAETLMESLPVPGKVESTELLTEGITEWTLSNGARVLIKPTTYQNDEILMSAYSMGGHSLYDDEDYFSANVATDIVDKSGLGELDNIQLDKYLATRDISLSAYIGYLSEGLRGSSTREDMESFMQLLYLQFTAPRFDPVAMQRIQSMNKSMIANRAASPGNYFYIELYKLMFPDAHRMQFPVAEDYDKIQLTRAEEIYRERFSNAGDFTFVFVGNIDPVKFKPLVEQYIGSLPGGSGDAFQETYLDRKYRYAEGEIKEEIFKGTEPQSRVQMTFHGDFEWSAENRLYLEVLEDVLRIKLRESLREDKGGVYGVGVNATPDQYPVEQYDISISFGCAPDNVEDLIESAWEEIEKISDNGPTATDLQKVKETMIRTHETDLESNRYWLNTIYRGLYNDDPAWEQMDSFYERVSNVTADDIQRMAQEYLQDNSYIQLILYPENYED